MAPLSNIWVGVFDVSTDQIVGWANSLVDGTYTIANLPAGTYKVWATLNGATYAGQFYGGYQNRDDATPVSLAPAGNLTGIDFSLSPGGQVTGVS